MIIRYPINAGSGGSGNEKSPGAPKTAAGKEGACRCKETADMTPRQLLGLMFSDLAFWKKPKKG